MVANMEHVTVIVYITIVSPQTISCNYDSIVSLTHAGLLHDLFLYYYTVTVASYTIMSAVVIV